MLNLYVFSFLFTPLFDAQFVQTSRDGTQCLGDDVPKHGYAQHERPDDPLRSFFGQVVWVE